MSLSHRFVSVDRETDRCEFCGFVMTIGVPYPSECPGWAPLQATLESTPTLVQIDEDLWVNPAAVFTVMASIENWTGRAIVTLTTSAGVSHVLEKPLSEVIALINGSIE